MRRRRFLMLVPALWLAACTSPERKQLDQTKGFVVRRLLEIRRDGRDYADFSERLVSGLSPLGVIMKGAPEGLSLVVWDEPARPWSVRLWSKTQGIVEIDLHGADLITPLDHMQVDMRKG